MPRRARDDHLANTDLTRDCRCMQRSRTAIRDEGETTGIETALGRYPLHGVRHLGRGDPKDPVRCLGRVEPERLGHLVMHCALGSLDIETHLATEKAIGAEPSEKEVGIGDGRF